MFYHFNCVLVSLLLFVVWLLVSLVGTCDASRDVLALQFGGALGREANELKEREVSSVLKVVYDHLKEAPPYSLVLHGNGSLIVPQLSRLKKMQHLVTLDNIHPHIVIYRNHNGQLQRAYLILAVAYKVSVSWTKQKESYDHYFVLSYDTRLKMLFIFSHIFSLSQSNNGSFDVLSVCSPPQPIPFVSVGVVAAAKPLVTHLKLISYNMWNTNELEGETYDDRINRMGKLLSNSGADIIALQEVRYDYNLLSDYGKNQIFHLYRHLKEYQYIFQPAMSYGLRDYIRVEEGVAVLSKYPIISHDYILLYRNRYNYEDDYHQRICLHVEVAVPVIGRLHVFVTHLSLNAVSRLRSVVEIWRFMSQYKGNKVLMGDLNTEPHSHTIRFLKGMLTVNGVSTENLYDVWDYAKYHHNNNSLSGLTFSTLEEKLTKRIDYIFTYLLPENSVQWVGFLDDGLRQLQATSDHVGVTVQLKFTRKL